MYSIISQVSECNKIQLHKSNLIRYNNRYLYVKTPQVSLSSIDTIDGSIYLSLHFTHPELINTIEEWCKNTILQNLQYWGLPETATANMINFFWIPSIRNNSMHYKTKGNIGIFDEVNEELPLTMIKPEYKAKALLLIKGIVKSGDYFLLDYELKQLKVAIPENVFENCQLSDGEEDSEDSIDLL